nr:ubiquitin-specific protease 13 [Tanacetum cinerariifolium]
FFHAIRDAKVNMKIFMDDIGFSALHSLNIDTLPNSLARFVVRAFNSKTYNFYLKTGVVHVTAKKVHEILGLPIGGISLYDLPERREDDEFVQRWLSQFAPKKKKRIFAIDIAEKLVCSTRVDFMFKVNFLMLFANVMGKANTMRAFVNLSVVRRIREDTNITGLDWCDFIHRCLAISHEPNTYLEIEDEAFGKLDIYGEWSENETVEAEGFCENSLVLPHTDKKPVENVKELAEKRKEPAEKAQEAPQNVKPKPAAVKTKEAAEKAMPTENVKELAEKPKEPAEGNIDWVGEDELHDWPRVVEPINMTLAPTLCVDANVIDCWVTLLNFEELALGYPTPTRHFFPTGCINQGIIKGTLTDEKRYLKEQNHSSHEAVAKMRPLILKLKWRTFNNHVDCGVFAMIHMENYCMRYKIATKIMLHKFNAVSDKMFDFAFTFERKYTEQAMVSMIVDAIKNRNNRDPPKQVKETESANVVVGVNEVVEQVKEKRHRKK